MWVSILYFWEKKEYDQVPYRKICSKCAGLCGRCPGVAVPLRVVSSPTGLPSKRAPGLEKKTDEKEGPENLMVHPNGKEEKELKREVGSRLGSRRTGWSKNWKVASDEVKRFRIWLVPGHLFSEHKHLLRKIKHNKSNNSCYLLDV